MLHLPGGPREEHTAGQTRQVETRHGPVAGSQRNTEVVRRRQGVEQWNGAKQQRANAQLLDPALTASAQNRMQQAQAPGDEEGLHFPVGTLGETDRQQPVSPEKRRDGDHQPGHAGDVQDFHQA
jgi:hypothetical protein